ncbi:MAG: hypothetical protein JXB47_21010 [Anaerolineae bacterium]|nr:hypothetical protein [Anaerolineae bacterium]
MKKLMVLILLASLLLGMLPIASAAAPAADLTRLASYYPEKTVLFAAANVNDTFAGVDTLAARLSERFPDLVPPDFTLKGALEALLRENFYTAGDFEALVGSWLGDTVAVGLPSVQSAMSGAQNLFGPFTYVVDITNRGAAEAFLGGILYASDYAIQRTETQTTYTAQDWQRDPSFAIFDEMMMVVPNPRMLARLPEVSLADDPLFTGAVGLLPGDDYRAILYLDTQGIMKPLMSMMNMTNLPIAVSMSSQGMRMAMDVTGPQVFGFAFLDDRTLMMDVVQQYADLTSMQERGVQYLFDVPPVDLEFAAHVPGDAPLVVQGTDFGPTVQATFDNLRALGPVYQEMFLQQLEAAREYMEPMQYQMTTNAIRRYLDFGHLVTLFDAAYAGLTGLNLEKDVLPWMTGDYAVFARLLPFKNATSDGYTLDVGVINEATDAEAIAGMMDGLQYALDSYNGMYTVEEVGGGQALVLPNIVPTFFPGGPYETALEVPELHLMVGANDAVFGWGTRPGVAFGMAPGEDNLAGLPAFIAAQEYFLEDATGVAFLNSDGLTTLAALYLSVNQTYVNILEGVNAAEAAAELEAAGARDAAAILKIIDLIDSASISAVSSEASMVQRFVVTLSE